eukprot:TRINITY_DN4792_c0_g1_i1.p1 TRINITY_DN4792_c0_g1~~TRINITY_DN4792_c0_g1_i1.p1  ORF type:complete len:284 (+),score=30.51 TRINITY_DN4792_c0_g1_i1:12-863(+)
MGNTPSPVMRVYLISDIHTDEHENWEVVKKWVNFLQTSKEDVLILAGDISQDLDVVEETLKFLKAIFVNIFYVPGNNELRLDKNNQTFSDSVEKFHHLTSLCQNLGIHTEPKVINEVLIVPLFGWYSPRFDKTWNGDQNYRKGWLDFHRCVWPKELDIVKNPDCIASYFTDLNEKYIKQYDDVSTIITFSHFLPRTELLPPSLFLGKRTLPQVVGFDQIEDQLRRLGSHIHCCGHTHINVDKCIDGVRYVQHALAHPHERKSIWRMFEATSPKLVFTKQISLL